MFVKILNAVLIIAVVLMGLKQGWAMIAGKPEMQEMLGRFHFNRTAILINGVVTVLSALLILFPRTFLLGNFLMAAAILLIMCFQLSLKDLRGAAIEVPFLLMNLVLVFLQHPLAKTN